MKISVNAVVAVTFVQLASGQRVEYGTTGMRGARADNPDAKKDVDLAPILKRMSNFHAAAGANDSNSNDRMVDPGETSSAGSISAPYKYESSKWKSRLIKADVSLDVDAFHEAVVNWSKNLCDLGITATLFDQNSEMVYQKTHGTKYTPFVEGGYSMGGGGFGPMEDGWTGDTVYTAYSNSKAIASATFLASVVDTGLGYLDEPISTTFTATAGTEVGKITPRQIMSHTSGLYTFNREDPVNDPYYSCKYDPSKSFRECLDAILVDEALVNPPGTSRAYNNEAFDILAEIALKKTGMNSYKKLFKKYLTKKLNMDSTTYDCPTVGSTSEKPNAAWGICSTGNDFPKFVQMLANGGKSPSGKQVLAETSVQQMFTHGGGIAENAGDLLWKSIGFLPFFGTRCYPRLVKGVFKDLDPSLADIAQPVTSVSGYGLGTMFFLGNYGEYFGHGGSTGGLWLVAPGRFAAYFTWMAAGTVAPEIGGSTYQLLADIMNAFENASTFTVDNEFGSEDVPQTIEMCGGMYEDLFSFYSIDSMLPTTPVGMEGYQCPGTEGGKKVSTKEAHPLAAVMKFAQDQALQVL
mmetsp:Transcript_8528/g.14366  ORF Transcript_8528/g.14366 Transcript_8528/m.14366 type:complete len:578 (+) Transcript_8528:50-1783(+)|eukprot:CAMPEP_0183708238 /NCGR_PEP_ID=MMETSP0737-20130205/4605_1 /TAXON_ID=385413 /ORGANISM="Thalassiosira miniscula, Strain CCMP1093" /LENGTH=577 /DNA_ID=CAMNT_0025936071 /DNA_START=158 /DNA_END=1891 /DNA_ORIENTATION=+